MPQRRVDNSAFRRPGTFAYGQDRDLTLSEAYDVHFRLLARPVFDQYQLAACEFDLRAVEQHDCLKREMERAIEVLVETIEIAGTVAEHQWRRTGLAGLMASGQKLIQPFGPARIARGGIGSGPFIGDGGQTRIEALAQRLHKTWQWIGEIAIFAAAEAVARHHDRRSKHRVLRIKRRQRFAVSGGEQRRRKGVIGLGQLRADLAPIKLLQCNFEH